MSYPKIILIVGQKQSGKSTAASQLEIELLDQTGDEFIDVGRYSFATSLKELCIENGWITYNQAYGTDAEKNSSTRFSWEDFPFLDPNLFPDYSELKFGKIINKTISARRLMQLIGTDIFRNIDPDIWLNRCLNSINEDYEEDGGPEISIIDDGRFENEVRKIKEKNGIVIYLTRGMSEDTHLSETELQKIPNSYFDYVINNQNFTKDDLSQEIKIIAKDILKNGYQEIKCKFI